MITTQPYIPKATFDLIVVGAGINGAGIARDAAMRGLKVLILDKGDIGGGTSSFSTRLIHGGLRYLEHGEFGLVRESLRERETLLHIAAHLVRPLPILIPIYDSGRRSSGTVRAGMLAYDLLAFGKSLSGHRMLSRTEALEEVAGLKRSGLKSAALYYDAQVEFAERLVLENVMAAQEAGAMVATYSKAISLTGEARSISVLEFQDQLIGDLTRVSGRLFINAAGPWVDMLADAAGPGGPRLIGGTKGSHIVVGDFASAPKTALYVEAQRDGRPFFIIPWNGQYLIGTTDIRYDRNPDDAGIDADEIDYLLNETNLVIPTAQLTRESILFSYCGVRPLPFTNDGAEARITRRHFIRRHPQFENLLSIVGGKLTTYRSLAEETVDLIGRHLRVNLPKCQTAETVLPGAEAVESLRDDLQQCQLSRLTIDHLMRVYGSRARQVVEMAGEDAALLNVIDEESGALAAEVVHAFKNEGARTLADCMLRRTMIGLNSDGGEKALETVAEIMHTHVGFSRDVIEDQVEDYRRRSLQPCY